MEVSVKSLCTSRRGWAGNWIASLVVAVGTIGAASPVGAQATTPVAALPCVSTARTVIVALPLPTGATISEEPLTVAVATPGAELSAVYCTTDVPDPVG